MSSLAVEAGNKALEMWGGDREEIGMVVVCTSSPDDLFGDATTVAAECGCPNSFAFDLTAACSGFLFGLVNSGVWISSGATKNVLLVGGDALSRWVDWDDRNTCILFGDGAGAVVVSADEAGGEDRGGPGPGILSYSLHSDGKGKSDLTCNFDGRGKRLETGGGGITVDSGGYEGVKMNGKEVYKFATRVVPHVLTEALDAASLTAADVDHLLLHQANIRIMEVVAKRLKIPMSKVISNLSSYGNTSAGSIPIALDEAVREGRVKKGDVIAVAGFGAGLSWGAAIIRWG